MSLSQYYTFFLTHRVQEVHPEEGIIHWVKPHVDPNDQAWSHQVSPVLPNDSKIDLIIQDSSEGYFISSNRLINVEPQQINVTHRPINLQVHTWFNTDKPGLINANPFGDLDFSNDLIPVNVNALGLNIPPDPGADITYDALDLPPALAQYGSEYNLDPDRPLYMLLPAALNPDLISQIDYSSDALPLNLDPNWPDSHGDAPDLTTDMLELTGPLAEFGNNFDYDLLDRIVSPLKGVSLPVEDPELQFTAGSAVRWYEVNNLPYDPLICRQSKLYNEFLPTLKWFPLWQDLPKMWQTVTWVTPPDMQPAQFTGQVIEPLDFSRDDITFDELFINEQDPGSPSGPNDTPLDFSVSLIYQYNKTVDYLARSTEPDYVGVHDVALEFKTLQLTHLVDLPGHAHTYSLAHYDPAGQLPVGELSLDPSPATLKDIGSMLIGLTALEESAALLLLIQGLVKRWGLDMNNIDPLTAQYNSLGQGVLPDIVQWNQVNSGPRTPEAVCWFGLGLTLALQWLQDKPTLAAKLKKEAPSIAAMLHQHAFFVARLISSNGLTHPGFDTDGNAYTSQYSYTTSLLARVFLGAYLESQHDLYIHTVAVSLDAKLLITPPEYAAAQVTKPLAKYGLLYYLYTKRAPIDLDLLTAQLGIDDSLLNYLIFSFKPDVLPLPDLTSWRRVEPGVYSFGNQPPKLWDSTWCMLLEREHKLWPDDHEPFNLYTQEHVLQEALVYQAQQRLWPVGTEWASPTQGSLLQAVFKAASTNYTATTLIALLARYGVYSVTAQADWLTAKAATAGISRLPFNSDGFLRARTTALLLPNNEPNVNTLQEQWVNWLGAENVVLREDSENNLLLAAFVADNPYLSDAVALLLPAGVRKTVYNSPRLPRMPAVQPARLILMMLPATLRTHADGRILLDDGYSILI